MHVAHRHRPMRVPTPALMLRKSREEKQSLPEKALGWTCLSPLIWKAFCTIFNMLLAYLDSGKKDHRASYTTPRRVSQSVSQSVSLLALGSSSRRRWFINEAREVYTHTHLKPWEGPKQSPSFYRWRNWGQRKGKSLGNFEVGLELDYPPKTGGLHSSHQTSLHSLWQEVLTQQKSEQPRCQQQEKCPYSVWLSACQLAFTACGSNLGTGFNLQKS